MRPPRFDIDLAAFHADPYPVLARLRASCPVAHVPQLDATLITRRDDVFRYEKMVDIFSSHQPDGLMTRLMGENMMRKDGAAHQAERAAIFPTVSPRVVRDHWAAAFANIVTLALDALDQRAQSGVPADLVADFAMQVSGAALVAITGLTDMTWQDMDRVSRGMIAGCANYAGDPAVTAECHACTALIDAHIAARLASPLDATPSLLSVMRRAGMTDSQLRANIKLAISGGQNEPRKAIAGTAWALMTHPDQHARVRSGQASYADAFAEYVRWISPIGMSPRRIAQDAVIDVIRHCAGDRVFLMFGAANRDPAHFPHPDAFDLTQDRAAAIAFGAGPHFCAGAWISRSLIGDIALPRLFARFPALRPAAPACFDGWAFRGPRAVPVWLQ